MSNGETKTEVKKPKRRKKKKLKIIIPLVLVIAVVFAAKYFSKDEEPSVLVYSAKVSTGDIDTELSVSGKVLAEESVTFFAPANTKVEGIEVNKGDVVKEGDVLLCFDAEAVAYAKKQSELAQQITSADYDSNMQYNNEQKEKLAQAQVDIIECEAEIANYEKWIDELTDGITDLTALKKSDLYAKIYSVEKEMNTYDLAIQFPTEDTDVEAVATKRTEKQNELNKLNQELNQLADYETDYGWEDMVTQAKKDLADYEEKLAEAKSIKASAEAAIANESKLTGYALNQTKSALETADAAKKYQAVLNGVVAGFNGVISELNVVEGASVQEGTQLMVLESFDNVCVEFQASKYALETLALGQSAQITISGRDYTGTVSKINHVAEANSSGTPMVAVRVHIDNPDENIFLGIDAKLKIRTASEKGVLQVPVEAVNIDSQGSFCYIIDNGVLTKKYVTTGISSETYIQIIDGLSKDQEIVTTSVYGVGLDEGMLVSVMPMSGMTATDTTTSTAAESEAVDSAAGQETDEAAWTQGSTEPETEAAAQTQENMEDAADNG